MDYIDYLYGFEDEGFNDYPGLEFDEEFDEEADYFNSEVDDIVESVV